MGKKLLLLINFSLIFLTSFSFVFFKPSFAQEVYDIVAYPARQQIEVAPGEKKRLAVTFLNRTLFPKSGILGTADFVVKGKDNTPTFFDQPIKDNRFTASSWISLPYYEATIPADSKIIVYFDVSVPSDALPGGHYAAIYFEGTPLGGRPSSTNEGVAITAPRTMALLYFKIKGEVKEEASITKFFAPQFLEYGPIKVEAEILNSGFVHLSPILELKLYNQFNQLIETKKIKEKNIFPQAIATFEEELGKKWMLGQYKIELTGNYGTSGGKLYDRLTVLVFPWKVALIITLTLIIIILLIRHLYQGMIVKERELEEELQKEREELEKLKKELKERE
jgi:hypothetical protein